MDFFKQLLLSLLLIFTAYSASAVTYTTINDGDWSNTTDVWSIDGVNPCGCAPSFTNNDEIIINHSITSSQAITFNSGGSLTVNTGGELSGNFNLSFNDATGTINGNVSVIKLSVDQNSEVTFNSSILTVTSQMDIYGTVNVDGGYLLMTGGNMIINPGAVFNTVNAGKVDVENGNITNSGEFNLCATCCFTTTGNWKNLSGGQVLGSGAAISTNGNMTNQGFWSPAVAWCSEGNSNGMPLFENCLTAEAICNLVVLPVEFGEISVTLNQQGAPLVEWFTISERDNAYFNVLRLSDTGNWEVIGKVDGAGTTTERQDYSFTDIKARKGINYYAIEQVDHNGESSRSEAVSIEVTSTSMCVYPNPVSGNGYLTVQLPQEGSFNIEILNPTGMVVYTGVTAKDELKINLQELSLATGVYLVRAKSSQKQYLQRVVFK